MPSTRSLGAGASGGGGGGLGAELGSELGPALGPELGGEVVGPADDVGFGTLLEVPQAATDTRVVAATVRTATRVRRAFRI